MFGQLFLVKIVMVHKNWENKKNVFMFAIQYFRYSNCVEFNLENK